MIILGIDSAGKQAGVAILKTESGQPEEVLYEANLHTGNTHSETLLLLVQSALRATQLSMRDIHCIGVCEGPGSFTGLRIGLATAKGLALAKEIPCAGVSTLESIARSSLLDGTLLCALDARRGEVYAAAFEKQQDSLTRVLPDSAVKAEALADFVKTCKKPLYLMGDGAEVCRGKLADIFADTQDVFLYPAPDTKGRAVGVCRAAEAAMRQGKAVSAEALVPEYHRLSQAQRERAEKLSAQAAAAGKPQ